jgi:hypothetical protein
MERIEWGVLIANYLFVARIIHEASTATASSGRPYIFPRYTVHNRRMRDCSGEAVCSRQSAVFNLQSVIVI